MSYPALLWSALLALALTLASGAVRAQADGDLAGIGAQVEQLAKESAGRAGLAGARIEVEVGSLDPRLKLAPCQRIEP